MGVSGSKPQQQTLTATPSPVRETDEDVQQAGQEEKELQKKKKGYESTMLRSPGLGENGTVQTAKNALLG